MRKLILLIALVPAIAAGQARQGSSVPWKQRLPGRNTQKLNDVLKLFGLGADQFARLNQNDSLSPSDQGLIEQLLFRLPNISLGVVERSMQSWPTAKQWKESPQQYAGQVFSVSGTLTRLTRQELSANAQTSFQYRYYYSAHIKTPSGVVTVLTRTVPLAFKDGSVTGQNVQASAVFTKIVKGPGHNQPLLVSSRLGWLPESPIDKLNVTADLVTLARIGFDIGLLDHLRTRNRTRGIGGKERESFYQLLSRLSQNAEMIRDAANKPQLAAILQQPETQQGRIFRFAGNLRRITKVVVNDADVRDRFKLTQYYQLDVFISLGKRSIRLGSKKDDPVIRTQFPMTFCVMNVPESLRTLADKAADDASFTMNEPVQLNAVFFKLWMFNSSFMDRYATKRADGSVPPQLGPLLLGTNLVHLKREDGGSGQITAWIIGGSGTVVLAVICFILWRMGRRDREIDRELSKKRFRLEDPDKLNDLDTM